MDKLVNNGRCAGQKLINKKLSWKAFVFTHEKLTKMGFNKKQVNFNKEKKKKIRIVRKITGAAKKHELSVKLVSGMRTSKRSKRMLKKDKSLKGFAETLELTKKVFRKNGKAVEEAANEMQE